MNKLECKFGLGDRVSILKTALPAIGTVTGIMEPKMFLAKFTQMPEQTKATWDKLLGPNWLNNPVYFVYYENPVPVFSIEEMFQKEGPFTEEERHKYKVNAQFTILKCHPECDLEPVEE